MFHTIRINGTVPTLKADLKRSDWSRVTLTPETRGLSFRLTQRPGTYKVQGQTRRWWVTIEVTEQGEVKVK